MSPSISASRPGVPMSRVLLTRLILFSAPFRGLVRLELGGSAERPANGRDALDLAGGGRGSPGGRVLDGDGLAAK